MNKKNILLLMFAVLFLSACNHAESAESNPAIETIEFQDIQETTNETAASHDSSSLETSADEQNDNSEKTTGSTEFKKYNDDWTEEQILEEIRVRKPYREVTAYYSDFLKYMEEVRECTDIAVYCYPLFQTDTQFYQASDFENVPPLIIHLAKNEIYARRGYIFNNPDLYNFYLTQLWYVPEIQAADFDDSVFNEYEKYNLELLSKLDTY
ncbi:MAG: YARHG domain-containing protein [Lachnospiraceae bacterium]|nr:YARHG domain-containing protein [Lachnospiraceae bacterium]